MSNNIFYLGGGQPSQSTAFAQGALSLEDQLLRCSFKAQTLNLGIKSQYKKGPSHYTKQTEEQLLTEAWTTQQQYNSLLSQVQQVDPMKTNQLYQKGLTVIKATLDEVTNKLNNIQQKVGKYAPESQSIPFKAQPAQTHQSGFLAPPVARLQQERGFFSTSIPSQKRLTRSTSAGNVKKIDQDDVAAQNLAVLIETLGHVKRMDQQSRSANFASTTYTNPDTGAQVLLRYSTRGAAAAVKAFDAASLPAGQRQARFSNTQILLFDRDCQEVAQMLAERNKNFFMLDATSGDKPGGEVYNGANGQEEQLCYVSDLLVQLDSQRRYQLTNYYPFSEILKSPSAGLYLPRVLFFRDKDFRFVGQPFVAPVGVVAALQLKEGDQLHGRKLTETRAKIRTILEMAYQGGHETLVLNDFGCKTFRNPPGVIAQIFMEELHGDYKNCFSEVCFSITKGPDMDGRSHPIDSYWPFAQWINSYNGSVYEGDQLVDKTLIASAPQNRKLEKKKPGKSKKSKKDKKGLEKTSQLTSSGASHPLLNFYLGISPNSDGIFLQTIWTWDYDKLEKVHSYIQWLFAMETPSGVNLDAPVLNNEIEQAFITNPQLKQNLLRSLDTMLDFYGLQRNEKTGEISEAAHFSKRKIKWIKSGDHNFLRITRILISLSSLGCKKEASSFFNCLANIYQREAATIGQQAFGFWQRAVQYTS